MLSEPCDFSHPYVPPGTPFLYFTIAGRQLQGFFYFLPDFLQADERSPSNTRILLKSGILIPNAEITLRRWRGGVMRYVQAMEIPPAGAPLGAGFAVRQCLAIALDL